MELKGAPIQVQGKHLRCVHCGSSRFVRRKAQFNNVAFMTFFDLSWVDKTAEIFICTTCGRLEWFLNPIVPSEAEGGEVHDDQAEPTECMACGETIPAGQDKCAKCGWTYQTRVQTIASRTNLEIVEAPVDEVIVSGLIAELDAELQRRYPGEPVNGIDAAEFQAAGGYFVVARTASDYAGCGAFRPLDASTVEIKRMFVRPEFRRQGTAWALLRALEAEARRRGYSRCVLETALRQPEAMALYRAAGYAEIEPFGPYVGSERSVCMGKTL